MKKTPPASPDTQNPVAAMMALISEEMGKAETLKDTAAFANWLEMGQLVMDKFGDSFEPREFRRAAETRVQGARESRAASGTENPSADSISPDPEIEVRAFEERFPPEAVISVLKSGVLICSAVIAGKGTAAGLKYDEENMLAPMIAFLEKGPAAEALVWFAENAGVPVIKNDLLAKNLVSGGKAGGIIPETSYRDVSLALARLGSSGARRRYRQAPRDWPDERIRKGLPVKIPRPLSLELGSSLFTLMAEEPGREILLGAPLNALRKRLSRLLGFSLPRFGVSGNPRLGAGEYRVLFKGLEAGRGKLELGWYTVRAADIPGGAFSGMVNSPENIRAAAKAAALVLVQHAAVIARKRTPELLGRDEVEAILEAAEEKYPIVTGEVKNLLSLGVIRDIFQNLVSEDVSIRHIAVILETLADWISYDRTLSVPSEVIIDKIRQSLKRQICLEYADERLTLRVLTLEPKLEQGFSDYTRGAPDPESAAMNDETWADLISSAARGMEKKGYPPVVLCSPRARSQVKEATRRKIPELAVLSYLEIPSDISVESMGEIQIKGNIRLPGSRGK